MANGNQSNGVGLAGFIVSLIGFVACQPLCLLGVILSLVGLGKEPKGFAIAGLIIGLLGSLLTILLIVLIAILGFGGFMASIGMAQFDARIELRLLALEVDEYLAQNGQLPADISVLTLDPALLTDYWGNDYDYRPQVGSTQYSIVSAGPDGQMGTADDIEVNTSTP